MTSWNGPRIRVGPISVKLIAGGDRVVAGERRGGFESATLRLWALLCATGGTVIDCGAYTGIYSISAKMLGASPIAIEPLPANRKRLLDNAALNYVSVLVLPGAAYDEIGTRELHYVDDRRMLTSGASLAGKSAGSGRLMVDTYPIDAMYLNNVRVIKIDVEGAEVAVLRGARETLKHWRPVLIVEALDGEAEVAVLATVMEAAPCYRRVSLLDGRNLVMFSD